MSDLIDRQAAIDAIEFGITYAKAINKETGEVKELFQASNDELRKAEDRIKQLPSAQPNLQPTCNQLATDCISRQAAIKAIENLQDCYNGFSDTYDKACIIGVLMEIPTAQVNTQTDTPTDMISRQAALALAKDICVPIKDGTVYRHRCIDPQQIMDLPSAQRTGRWKVSYLPKGKMKYCSECGFGQYIADERQYNFCPNCGADMRGEDDE